MNCEFNTKKYPTALLGIADIWCDMLWILPIKQPREPLNAVFKVFFVPPKKAQKKQK